MRDIKLISLDIWGTLLKSNPLNKVERTKILAEVLGCETSSIEASISKADEEIDVLSETTGEDFTGERRVAEVLSRMNVAADVAAIRTIKERLNRAFLTHLPAFIEQNAPEIIQDLKSRGFQIALLSNTGFMGGAEMREMFQELGFLSLVDYAIFSNEVGMAKPHEDIFLHLAKTSHHKPEEILHVGNMPEADCEGAVRAGCQTLLFDQTGKYTHMKILSITSLSQISQYI